MPRLSAILNQAEDNAAQIVRLSPVSVTILRAAFDYLENLRQWTTPDYPDLSASDQDTIQAIVAAASLELNTMWGLGITVPVFTATMPDGILECNGSVYTRAAYPALYAVLDPAYIIDADTFRTPDLRGLTIIGAGEAASGTVFAVNSTGGEEKHTMTEGELVSHDHTDSGHAHTYIPPTLNLDLESPGAPDLLAAGIGVSTLTGSASANIQPTGGSEPFNVMQPYLVARWGIVAE